MLLLLIKNEFIKILKRTKTWIVFGLFVLFIGIGMYGLYSQEKKMEKYNSPQYKLEQVERDIKNMKQEIDRFEGSSKSSENENEEHIQSLKQNIKKSEKARVKYEDQIKNGVSPDAWRVELDENIKSSEETLSNDSIEESEKVSITENLDELKYLKENNIKPLHDYEFNAYNYMQTIMMILGTILLVVGIAVFMSDIVSGECTPPTLKFLLVQPISRGKVLLSKFIAVTITVVTMITSMELLAFLGIGIVKGFGVGNYPKTIGVRYSVDFSNMATKGYPDIMPIHGTGSMVTFNELIVKALLLQILFMITCCAFIFLISTLFKSSNVTTTIAIIATVAGTIGFEMFGFLKGFAHLVFLNYGSVASVITGDIAYNYKNGNLTPINGVVVMLVTIIISYVIAHIVFKKKDILI
ncbi:ABC transporter permease subunit [Clostridium uliginosum]|uniref:ABC-2 type transport system permease protein n=1 Tax=Clostridium uliginosum TaxID=119641 RepID=A0A1I1PI46_9CLOT|nr:ABC transporter permease subunit [Clostridium uliginosum]SFD05720.1 ABC-2 type transport system permease protein [Clostridium uliginosum]